jgi:hypothetical protein
LIVPILVLIALVSVGAGKKTPVQGFAPGIQNLKILNTGLQAPDYGYHPDNDGSWGESWYLQGSNADGDFVVALISVSNYNPFHKFTGTADLFYYPATGEKFKAHQEFKSEEVKADTKRVMAQMGIVSFSGDYPAYRLTAKIQDIDFDLTFAAETKDLKLGQDKILFGDKKDRYWNLTVLAPRAAVNGNIICKGKKIPFSGKAYLEHGWSTQKIYKFSSKWYILRILQDDFSMNTIQMVFKDGFDPGKTQAICMTLGDKIIANSGALELIPSEGSADPKSKVVLPDSYKIHYALGDTRLDGTIKMTRKIEGLNILDQLSPLVRGLIKGIETDPWQFRFEGQADLTLEHSGKVRKIGGQTFGEVYSYK